MATAIEESARPERTDRSPDGAAERPSDPSSDSTPGPKRPKQRWWRRPWVVPLTLVTVAFVAFSLPRYLTLDPAQSNVPAPEGFSLHYPLLVAHVVFGSVAILTCILQVWPWFRQRYPAAHRISGRIYVFGGVLPSGAMGLVVGALSPFGPVTRLSNVMLAVLWLVFTWMGFRMARQRRYADHRRWMIRSFALTLSIITNRIWGAVFHLALTPQLETTFNGDETLFVYVAAGMTGWFSWTTCLLVAEWWLVERRRPRRVRAS